MNDGPLEGVPAAGWEDRSCQADAIGVWHPFEL